MEYCNNDFYRSTFEFHKDRYVADHINESMHYIRIKIIASMIEYLIKFYGVKSLADLGCGSGGVLSLLSEYSDVVMQGMDFSPSNARQAQEWGRPVTEGNFLVHDWSANDVVCMSEVLEHMTDPHSFLAGLGARYIVASCPADEGPNYMREEHVWAWDENGFLSMFNNAGYSPIIYNVYSGPGMKTQFFCGEKR